VFDLCNVTQAEVTPFAQQLVVMNREDGGLRLRLEPALRANIAGYAVTPSATTGPELNG
jgi:hypothetical protein